jgi:hypothetical protein
MPPCQGPHGSDGRRVGEAGDPGTLYIRYYTFYQQSRINDQISQKPPAQRGLACRYPESGSHGSACSPLSSRGWEVLYFVWYCIPMGAVGVADHPHANPKIILKDLHAPAFPLEEANPPGISLRAIATDAHSSSYIDIFFLARACMLLLLFLLSVAPAPSALLGQSSTRFRDISCQPPL